MEIMAVKFGSITNGEVRKGLEVAGLESVKDFLTLMS